MMDMIVWSNCQSGGSVRMPCLLSIASLAGLHLLNPDDEYRPHVEWN